MGAEPVNNVLTRKLPKELKGKLPDARRIEAEILKELGAPKK